ncbi:hypothetical protein Tco_0889134 [Tanacetum coccineum]
MFTIIPNTNRGSCGIRDVSPFGQGYTRGESKEQRSRTWKRTGNKYGGCRRKPQEALRGTIEGFRVRMIYVEWGSSSKIMYERCFKSFGVNIKSRLRKSSAPLVGFSGEIYHLLGLINLKDAKEYIRRSRAELDNHED